MSIKTLRGDTLIEIIFAIAIFSALAAITMGVMNNGVSRAQGALELTQARLEIDAQAETIRFINNANTAFSVNSENYSDFDNPGGDEMRPAYTTAWNTIAGLAISGNIPNFYTNNCNDLYSSNTETTIFGAKAFIVNTRKLETVVANKDESLFTTSSLYPRVVYSSGFAGGGTTDDLSAETDYIEVARVEGIFDLIRSGERNSFYDVYIFTCWNAPGSNNPTTIGTVMRLYKTGGLTQ